MNNKAIIVGAGTYGQVYAEYLKEEYDIIGFIDDNKTIHNNEINNIKVLGDIEYLLNEIDTETNIFVPIGNNKVRVNLLERIIDRGFKTPNFIHKDSIIHPSVKIGKCVYILPGTNIMPLSVIRDYVLVSMGVNIAHHTIIEKGCFFSQGSNIGANIHFEENVFCGIASTIMTGVKNVGKDSLIGAGAVVIRDVEEGATVVGNPAKRIK